MSYTIERAEKEIKDYVEWILFQHDLSIFRNDTNKKIYDKIITKCVEELKNNAELLNIITNRLQVEYFVRQTMLYLLTE